MENCTEQRNVNVLVFVFFEIHFPSLNEILHLGNVTEMNLLLIYFSSLNKAGGIIF